MTVTSPPAAPVAVHLADYVAPPYRAESIELLFELFDDHARVTSTTAYVLEGDVARDDGALPELVLDGEETELLSLVLDGTELGDDDFSYDAQGRLVLQPETDSFTLQVVTRIEPQNNTKLSGLYRSGGTFCTQMEAQGFRRVTWFQDRPDVLSVYTTTIVADKARFPMLLGNGNLVDSGDADGARHFATWHDPFPKPCYLFALVAGDLGLVQDVFTTCSGRTIPLHIYVDKGNESKAAHAMTSLKHAMKWDEDAFGREYDLDLFMLVAVNDFNMGAMENKGLNIFNAMLVLADETTATDDDFQRIEGVVGHEYFHNWSGNRVTCRDWFQLSLKEGFTVYRDQEFSSDMGSRAVQRIADVRALRKMQFPEDAGPLAHPVRPSSYIAIDNFYTLTVYEKGAEVIRMYEALLGKDGFRKGSDLYFERHDGQAVTTDDFAAAMSDANGVDLTLFKRWYEQAGTPRVQAQGRWDAGSRVYELELSQSCPPTPGQPRKLPFQIPVRLGLLGPDGQDIPLRLDGEPASAAATTRVLSLDEPRKVFRFVDVPAAPVPSLLRGFSAPVVLEIDLDDAQLAFLAAHDADPFNRWEALQRLATRAVLGMVAERAAGREMVVPAGLIDAVGGILRDETAEEAMRAEALRLPEESLLGDAMHEVDVDGIHAARELVLATLGRTHHDVLRATYERLAPLTASGTDGTTAGRRALKNACLLYLVRSGDEQALALCDRQSREARTMTDEQAALELLVDVDDPRREAAVARFRERWVANTLVMNKWFEVQASALRPDVVEEVRRLARDPAFDAGNPNKLRALYRTFARNPVGFHRADGEGYALMGELVRQVDPKNPIMAARLASFFNPWRRYDAGRRALAKQQLDAILAVGPISPNTFEIVSRALA